MLIHLGLNKKFLLRNSYYKAMGTNEKIYKWLSHINIFGHFYKKKKKKCFSNSKFFKILQSPSIPLIFFCVILKCPGESWRLEHVLIWINNCMMIPPTPLSLFCCKPTTKNGFSNWWVKHLSSYQNIFTKEIIECTEAFILILCAAGSQMKA